MRAEGRRAAPILLAAALALAALQAACGSPGSGPGGPVRFVLLYAPCTVNKDELSPYAPRIPFTPRLEAFAREGVVFARHHTEAGQSGIAYASIFTGSQADHHGAWRHPVKLREGLTLIPEAFGAQGYETFFWSGHGLASPRLGYAQGVPDENAFDYPLRSFDPRFLAILDRLAADPGYRALVIATYTDTHGPYRLEPVERFRREYPAESEGLPAQEIDRYAHLYRENHVPLEWNHAAEVRRLGLSPAEHAKLVAVVQLLYEANIHELDRRFGELLSEIDARGLKDESLIAFTADHGEVLFRENALFEWSHSMQPAPEVLNVPLLIRGPGLRPGRYEGVTRSIDVFPTLAGLAGVAIPAASGVQGVDLAPALTDRAPAPDLTAFSHSTVLVHELFRQMQAPGWERDWGLVHRFFPDEDVDRIWVSLRSGDRFYIWRRLGERWGVQAFDLDADPGLLRNSFDPADARDRESAEALRAYKARLVEAHRAAPDDGDRSPDEDAALLRGLGYVR